MGLNQPKYIHYTVDTMNLYTFVVGETCKWIETQNVSSTREHTQASRLNIVFQGINIEDGARVSAPNFEIFCQQGEISK